jgi:ABC-type xylose transport system permease subunit
MVVRMRLEGRKYFLVNGYIRLTIGSIFVLIGIVVGIMQKNMIYFGIFVLMGVVAILGGWYMLRRANNPDMNDLVI